jgi:outer membrane protein
VRNKFLAGGFVAATLLAASAVPAAAQSPAAADGKHAGSIMVRARVIDVIPQNSSSSISVIGGTVRATDSITPEVDFSYFITDNIALELIAATTKHTISGKDTLLGNPKVGTTWVLPPALTLQYHFMPQGSISPYVGAGLNYTIFYNSKAAGGAVTSMALDNNVGGVLQLGVDFKLGGAWYGNIDVKQIFVSTKAKLNGGTIVARTDLNPTVVGIGVGYRF